MNLSDDDRAQEDETYSPESSDGTPDWPSRVGKLIYLILFVLVVILALTLTF